MQCGRRVLGWCRFQSVVPMGRDKSWHQPGPDPTAGQTHGLAELQKMPESEAEGSPVQIACSKNTTQAQEVFQSNSGARRIKPISEKKPRRTARQRAWTCASANRSPRTDSTPLRLILPQVVEISLGSGRVVAIPAEEPEIARQIDPARGAESTSGDVGGGYSQHAVDSGL